MAAWYTIQGELELQPCAAVDQILNQLNAFSIEDRLCPEYDRERGILSFSEGALASYTVAVSFEGLVRSLGQHVRRPAVLVTSYDHDESTLYVGPPEERAEAESEFFLQRICDLLKNLTAKGKQRLKRILEEEK